LSPELLQHKFEVLFGNAAPEFDYVSLSGNKTALKQFRGKVVVLDFWEAWCGWLVQGGITKSQQATAEVEKQAAGNWYCDGKQKDCAEAC